MDSEWGVFYIVKSQDIHLLTTISGDGAPWFFSTFKKQAIVMFFVPVSIVFF